MRHKAFVLTGVVATLLLFAGCTLKQRTHSGFLGDYSGLEPGPNVQGSYVYRKPGFDPAQYGKFMIDPIGVHFAPDAAGSAVSPDTLKQLTDYFHAKLVEELSEHYQVVDQPGVGVMQLRIAITDVKKATAALNIHPATKLSGVGLGGASIEAEGIDTESRQRLFAFVHTREGNRLSIAEGLQDWGHAKQAMDFWAEQLVARLDEAHGKTSQ